MTEQSAGRKSVLERLWGEWRTLLIFLLVMFVFRSALADWYQVPTPSMNPTILPGDRVVVNKLAYDLKFPFTTWHLAEWSHPKRGEIVTFYSPADEKRLIKRIIGTPGDRVSMRNNQLFINDAATTYRALDEEIIGQLDDRQRRSHAFYFETIDDVVHPVMIQPSLPTSVNSFGPITVPPDHYLVLGDNRDNSADSRAIGFIARDRITGRAHTVAFSVDYEDHYLPRIDRFIRPLQ